jgi:hypothetical protein
MTKLGQLNQVYVIPTSKVNGVITTYQINVNTYKPLHSGDFFEITFPEGVNENGVTEG